jgi:lysophospholipase
MHSSHPFHSLIALESSSHGAGLLWSDIKNFPTFQNFSYLFPIVIADSRPSELSKSTDRPPLSSTIYEVNSCTFFGRKAALMAGIHKLTPFEMGSFDPWLSSMADIQYIGTTLVNGQPENSSACVTGFDQASFLIGTVSSLWNVRVY